MKTSDPFENQPPIPSVALSGAPAPADPVVLELRDLEPPEPLRIALETLATLPPQTAMIARTRFRPVHLLSVLEDRAFSWETIEQPDGSWETSILQSSATESP